MNFSKIARPYARLTNHALWRTGARDIAKQLPPSASKLRLLDVACGPGFTLRELVTLRPDILPIGLDLAAGMLHQASVRNNPGYYVNGDAYRLPFGENTFDAVLIQRTYYFLPDKPDLLREALRVLRPGGRLVVVNPVARRSPFAAWRALRYGGMAAFDMFIWRFFVYVIGGYTPESLARELDTAGFARILSEPIMDGWTVMGRGEKPYAEGTSARERVPVGAADDAADESTILQGDAIHAAPGRYIHLLISQSPNKPVWNLEPDEVITWGAAAVFTAENTPLALGFTSLPRAVAFMQNAVMTGDIKDVNKVAKFSKSAASTWDFPVLLNPSLENVRARYFLPGTLITIDPDSAESPDE